MINHCKTSQTVRLINEVLGRTTSNGLGELSSSTTIMILLLCDDGIIWLEVKMRYIRILNTYLVIIHVNEIPYTILIIRINILMC